MPPHPPQPILPRHQALAKAPIDVIAAKEGDEDVEQMDWDNAESERGDLHKDLLLEAEKLALASGKSGSGIASLGEGGLVCGVRSSADHRKVAPANSNQSANSRSGL